MKNQSKEKRSANINKFNKPVEESSFLVDFQKIMLERLILNYEHKFNKKNVDRIVRRVTNRNPQKINTSIKDGLLLSCVIDPSIYILLQETNKDIFGKYIPIDELIQDLLMWFIYYYSDRDKKNNKKLPFILRKKSNRSKNLKLFEKKFMEHYKNI